MIKRLMCNWFEKRLRRMIFLPHDRNYVDTDILYDQFIRVYEHGLTKGGWKDETIPSHDAKELRSFQYHVIDYFAKRDRLFSGIK